MTNITQFPLNALCYMRQNQRRAPSAARTTTTRQPPQACRDALRRERPTIDVGDYVMHNGGRFPGQIGHVIDVKISDCTRTVLHYLVSFSGLHACIQPVDLNKVTRAHQIVSDAMRGA